MRRYRHVFNETQAITVVEKAGWCASLWCHFRGLQFRFSLPDDEGLLFVRNSMSVSATAIHMFFCFFPIGVVWVDDQLRVVDAKLAKPWRPYYAAQAPAQYYLEARPLILDRVAVGDQLRFDEPEF